MVLKIDEEDFGGHGALLQEGLFASTTLFLVSWHPITFFPFFFFFCALELNESAFAGLKTNTCFYIVQLVWILVYSLAHF